MNYRVINEKVFYKYFRLILRYLESIILKLIEFILVFQEVYILEGDYRGKLFFFMYYLQKLNLVR